MSLPITAEEVRRHGALPLVIALRAPDGAWSAEAEDALAARFAAAVARLGRSFPGTPVRARSLLADRLDARIALAVAELPDVVVEALVPEGVEVARRLDDLGLGGDRALVPTPARLPRGRLGDVGDGGEAAWRSAAGYPLVRHAIVLVAAWTDDADPDVAGSTAELVRRMTLGPRLDEEPGATPRVGPADLGPVLRAPLGADDETWWEPGNDPFTADARPGRATRRFGRGLRLPPDMSPLRRYNLRVARLEGTADRGLAPLPDHVDANARRVLDARFLAADAVAVRGQRRVNGLRGALIALALIASFGLSFYARAPESTTLLIVFLVGIAAGTLLVRAARWRHLEESYLDARMLAEGMRVLRAWHAAGIADDPVHAYPMEHALDTTWIRQGLRATWVALASDPADEAHRAEGLAWAHEHWVRDQRSFYEGQLARDRDYSQGWGLAVNVVRLSLFGGLVGLAVLHGQESPPSARSWLIFAIVGSLTTLGMLRNLRDGLSFDLQVHQYGWCRRLFAQEPAPSPADARTPEAIRGRYLRLGRSALEEQSAWLHYHRLRPIRRS